MSSRTTLIRTKYWMHNLGVGLYSGGLALIWYYSCWQVALGVILVTIGSDCSAAARTMPIGDAEAAS